MGDPQIFDGNPQIFDGDPKILLQTLGILFETPISLLGTLNLVVSNKKGVFNSTLEKAKHHLSFVILFNKLNNMHIGSAWLFS